jgi:CRISPR-associated protein Csm2
MSYQNTPRRNGEQWARSLVSPDELKTIITGTTPEAIKLLTDKAAVIGEELAKHVSASQIRNIFGTVRTIEQDVIALSDQEPLPIQVQRSLMMLRPKLAYQYGRVQGRDDDTKKAAMGALNQILAEAIGLVGASVPHFHNFMDFFEAILAYHRRFGGSNN